MDKTNKDRISKDNIKNLVFLLLRWEIAWAVLIWLFVIFCFYVGWLADFENRLLDLRFEIRGAKPLHKDLVLVVINDETIERFGSWPWPRAIHANLVEKLKNAGAKIIAFDIFFQEASSFGHQDDEIFANSIKNAQNVILPIVFERKQVWDNETLETVSRIVCDFPVSPLKESALDLGFIDMEYQKLNPDGVLRYALLFNEYNYKSYYALGLVLAAKYLNLSITVDNKQNIYVGSVKIPTYKPPYIKFSDIADKGIFMINYFSQTGYFDEIAYHDVIEGKFHPNFFANKAVIIGTSTKGTAEDRKFCPFGVLLGMEVHAHLFQTIVSKCFLFRVPSNVFSVLLLILSLLVAYVLAFYKNMLGNIAVLVMFVIAVGANFVLFKFNIVYELVPIILIMPIQWSSTRLLQQFIDLRRRNKELAQLNLDLQKKNRELSVLNEISKAIIFMDNLDKTLYEILLKSVEILSADSGALLLYDSKYENLVSNAVFVGNLSARSMKLLSDIGKILVTKNNSILLNNTIEEFIKDTDFWFEYSKSENEVKSIIGLPLLVSQTPIGVMIICNKKNISFEPHDLRLADIMANQASIVIEQTRLYNLATIDGLTGLIVHRHFQSKLEEEFRRAKRYEKPLSLIMTDIDHFKKFNDTWGHQTGDLVLREVAKCVRQSIRETDIAARYGGEEFAIILPETDLEGAAQFAERLRIKVENTSCQGPSGPLKVTISLGVASFPYNKVETTQELIKLADEALYVAKRNGRNQYKIASN